MSQNEIDRLTCEEFAYFLAHGEKDVFTSPAHDEEVVTLTLIETWLGDEACDVLAAR